MNINKMKRVCSIFLTFAKIGPSTFGGGYAMIPLIEREVVERKKWLKTQDIADIFAVAESVPGAIAINSAAFIGYRLAGAIGAVSAMIGIMIPTFVIVVLLSVFFGQVHDNPKIEAALLSIRATIVALIVYAAYKIGKTAVVDKTTALMVLVTVALLYFLHSFIHPALLIVAGAMAGIVIVGIRSRMGLETLKENHNEIYDYMI